jgi:ribose 5-phosphate isomerase B
MKIAIGADHRGFLLKEQLKKQLPNIEWIDVGASTQERSDYPIFVRAACELMRSGRVEHAVLLCGSGVGMSIAANRYKGIFAALVWSAQLARMAKEDDNVNVLVFAADITPADEVIASINAWLQASFKGGQYAQRLAMIDSLV